MSDRVELPNGTTVEVGDSWARVTLPDGRSVMARPMYDADQAGTARELGYGADVEAMTRDHDPLHAILADWIGMPMSESLRVAAGDASANPAIAELEERAVIALQALIVATGARVLDLASRKR